MANGRFATTCDAHHDDVNSAAGQGMRAVWRKSHAKLSRVQGASRVGYRGAMSNQQDEFARYCGALLSGLGPCAAKRMWSGFGISARGLTFALVADLGGGAKLWLKATDEAQRLFEAEGC